MKFSHSRVDTYVRCPYKYYLKYIKNLRSLDNYTADNPLKIGTMLHTAIEKDLDIATKEYYDSCPIITDEHITETLKIEVLLPRVKKMLPVGEHEVKIETDYFIGFIDLLVPIDEDTYDLYDFKYSNNINSYLKSGQLHGYKYFFEKTNPGKKIRKLYYLFVPKSKLRVKKNEDIYQFRQRVIQDLQMKKVQLIEVEYDRTKVITFFNNAIKCSNARCYPKAPSDLCNFCEYKKYCLDEIDYEITRGGY